MTQTHRTLLRGVVGLALLAALVPLARPGQIVAELRGANPWWLLAGLVAAIASNLVSAWRWRLLARWLGGALGMADATRWYFQAIGLNALLPGAVVGGDVYRAVALRRSGGSGLAAGGSVVLDRLSGLWMLCALGGLGAAGCAPVLAPWTRLSTAWFAALALTATALWLALPWSLPALLRRRWRLLAPLRPLLEHPGFHAQLAWQTWASALVQLLSIAALAAGALALDVRQPIAVWAFVSAPIFLMAALPVSIGGWGTREAAAVIALAPFGVPAAAAVGSALIYGAYALVQGALGALAFGLPRRDAATSSAKSL